MTTLYIACGMDKEYTGKWSALFEDLMINNLLNAVIFIFHNHKGHNCVAAMSPQLVSLPAKFWHGRFPYAA